MFPLHAHRPACLDNATYAITQTPAGLAILICAHSFNDAGHLRHLHDISINREVHLLRSMLKKGELSKLKAERGGTTAAAAV